MVCSSTASTLLKISNLCKRTRARPFAFMQLFFLSLLFAHAFCNPPFASQFFANVTGYGLYAPPQGWSMNAVVDLQQNFIFGRAFLAGSTTASEFLLSGCKVMDSHGTYDPKCTIAVVYNSTSCSSAIGTGVAYFYFSLLAFQETSSGLIPMMIPNTQCGFGGALYGMHMDVGIGLDEVLICVQKTRAGPLVQSIKLRDNFDMTWVLAGASVDSTPTTAPSKPPYCP